MLVSQRWLRMSGVRQPRQRGIADLRHYNAEFSVWGSGPTLVLVPGLAGGTDLVEPLARALAGTFRVIAYEIRGETDCFALRQRFAVPDLADDLAELVRWLGLERPLLFGTSFGGVIGLTCAARHPRLFSGLAVQGVGYRFDAGLAQRIATMVLSSYPLPRDSGFVNQFFNFLFGGRPDADAFDHATRTCWQTDQGVMTHRLRLLRRVNLEKHLPNLAVPGLVVAGNRDMVVSPRNARALAAALPAGRLSLIDTAGHLAPVSHARQIADAVTQFLAPLAS